MGVMRRPAPFLLLGGLLLAAACGRSGAYELGLPGGDTPTPDPTTPTPTPTPSITQCPADSSLVGCWPLDGSFADGSTQAHVASVSNVGFVSGVAGQAGSFAATSSFSVPFSASFNLSAMTVEAWVRLSALPVGGPATVLHRPPTILMSVQPDGSFECTFDGSETVSSGNGQVDANSWTHVACTFDPNDSLGAWVGGGETAQSGADSGPDTSTSPLRIGSAIGGGDDFLGEMDVIRIWNRVLAPSELCAAAGTSC